jgi:uncharacterized protein (DUF1697 family)
MALGDQADKADSEGAALAMASYVSLFRGINVGGHRLVPMSKLKDLHESLGLGDVATYIQSGNVIFTSDEPNISLLPGRIEATFAARFGFHSDVIVRSAADLATIVANNPFANQPTKETKWVMVMFLATPPTSTAEKELMRTYSGPEEFRVVDREMYIYYPTGSGRSKLTGTLIEKKLETVGTARNWNTVLKLQSMCGVS